MNDESSPSTARRSTYFKDFISYAPLVTAFLVFLGFLNYDLYYRKLDIDIFPFLDASELIFSIVKEMYPLILLGISYVLFLYLSSFKERNQEERSLDEQAVHEKRKQKKTEELDNNWSWSGILGNLKASFSNLKKNNFKLSFKLLRTTMGGVIYKLFTISLWIFGIFFGFVFFGQLNMVHKLNKNPIAYMEIDLLLPLSLFWLMIVVIYSITKFSRNNKKIKTWSYYLLVIMVFIANLNVHQNGLARKTYFDWNKKNICFSYHGDYIDTSGSMSLMGITKNYIFIRETSNNENLIFPIQDVKNMVIYSE